MTGAKKVSIVVSVNSRTIIRVVTVLALTFLGIRFLASITHFLGIIGIAFFLALALNPAISWIIRHLQIKSRVVAAALAYIILLAILIGLILLTIPPLVRQTSNFINQLPATVHNLSTQDSAAARFVRQHNLTSQLDTVASGLTTRLSGLRWSALTTAANVGTTFITIITVFVMTFMMLVEAPYWGRRFWEFYPDKHREAHKRIAASMYRIVTGYVNGQILIAAIAAGFALVTMLVASSILNVSINVVGLAGIVGLVGLIPMIGNTIAAVIVVLICLFSSIPLAIVMAVFFLVYQQVENVTIQPYVQAKFNELTPLLVFVAALLGVGFGGLLGAFIAIPLAGCLKIVFNEYLQYRGQSGE